MKFWPKYSGKAFLGESVYLRRTMTCYNYIAHTELSRDKKDIYGPYILQTVDNGLK